MEKKKLSLTWTIVIGLVLGVIAGLLLQGNADIAKTYIKPIGTIYMNLIKMIVVPVVLLSIIQGAKLEEIAVVLGYSTTFNFSRAFKNQLGLSPSAYRKQNKQAR